MTPEILSSASGDRSVRSVAGTGTSLVSDNYIVRDAKKPKAMLVFWHMPTYLTFAHGPINRRKCYSGFSKSI